MNGVGERVEIETKNDIRLVGRAINENWDIPRAEVIEALMDVIRNRDPDLMVGAADVLRKMDEVNVKRRAIQQREIQANEDRRLQLIELAQRIPVGELAKLASSHRSGSEAEQGAEGRAPEPTRVDGEETGG